MPPMPILFWLSASAIAVDAYYVLFHRAIPNIRTAPAIRAAMIDMLKQDAARKGGQSYTVVDIGSGNGLLTRSIAEAMPEAKVVGVEIARQSVIWSNWMKRRAGLGNLDYRHMDFMTYDFGAADAVVMYLVPGVMQQVGKRLHATARPGALIISNKFPIGDGWQPVQTDTIPTLYPHQGKVHVYRKE